MAGGERGTSAINLNHLEFKTRPSVGQPERSNLQQLCFTQRTKTESNDYQPNVSGATDALLLVFLLPKPLEQERCSVCFYVF